MKRVPNMINFEAKNQKPHDISPYIDYDKGWKLTENDKDFLIRYYENWVKAYIEECDGDFVDEPNRTLNSIKEKGVMASKDLIQEDARDTAYAVCDDIYEYYKNDADTLRLIENSILDTQWETNLAFGKEREVYINWKKIQA